MDTLADLLSSYALYLMLKRFQEAGGSFAIDIYTVPLKTLKSHDIPGLCRREYSVVDDNECGSFVS